MKAARAATGSAMAAMRPSSDGDCTVPGQMALQRIPWVTKSCATDLVRPITAALLAPYAQRHRRHVDDRAAAARQHAGEGGADHPVHGCDIEIETERPVRRRAVEDRAVVHEARAVEEHVRGEAAAEQGRD